MKKFFLAAFNLLLVVLAIFSAGLGVKSFLLANGFIDGGVTGVSLLLASILGWPLPILIFAINIPFVLVGYRQIGRRFAIRSTLVIAGFSLVLAFVKFPHVTSDRLLDAVFGGFFLGGGVGLAIRSGAVLDGTEIAALLISKSSNLLRVGDVILLLNVVIFSAAAFFLGIEVALYSMLTYFAASKTVDFLIHGVEEHTAVIIMSDHSEEIRHAILRHLRRGVTIYKGRGGLRDTEQDILFCVITRLEIGRIKSTVHEIDQNAFIVVHPLADAEGGVIKKHSHA